MKFPQRRIWIGNDPELCEKVQLALFKRGYTWDGVGTRLEHRDDTIPAYCDEAIALYTHADGHIAWLGEDDGREYFDNEDTEEFPEMKVEELFYNTLDEDGNYW